MVCAFVLRNLFLTQGLTGFLLHFSPLGVLQFYILHLGICLLPFSLKSEWVLPSATENTGSCGNDGVGGYGDGTGVRGLAGGGQQCSPL